MDVELRDAIGQGFGPEPPHRPVTERLEAGHRAVRRRRWAAGTIGACVAVAAIATSAALMSGGNAGSVTPADAIDPTTGPSVPDAEVGFDQDGRVVLGAPGIQVLQRVDGPLGDEGPGHHSVAMDLLVDGTEQWDLAEWYRNPPQGMPTAWVVVSSPTQAAPDTFEEWVANNASANGAADQPPPVRFDGNGRLVSANDLVEVLQTTDHPQLGASFAPPSAPVGAALLLIRGEGKRWIVARDLGTGIEVIPVPYDRGGDTMAAFLDYARAKYAAGEGLR